MFRLIPLRDINPTRRFPLVNIVFISLNVVAFGYELSLGPGIENLFASYGVVPAHITGLFSGAHSDVRVLFTALSSMFLHAGWLHLIGNMLYLWVFGDNVEDKLGRGRFLVFYILCGVAATGSHIAMDPHSVIPTIGASGAVSGVLGAYLVMFPKVRVITVIPIFIFLQIAELPAIIVLGFWFILQFLSGVLSLGMDTAGGGIAWWAHIGGFVAGALLVIPLRKYRS